jgi:hypothetical protein
MNFNEKEIIAAAMIGFDMIDGPTVKWVRQFQGTEFQIDIKSFLMNFYLSFRGGDEKLQPIAILYGDFYIVAFPRGLELCCLFLRPDSSDLPKLERLSKIASEIITQMDEMENTRQESAPNVTSSGSDFDEIKRIAINLLHGQEMSTPELRRYFKLTNSEIWLLMGQLEESNAIIRTQKVGRTQYWTAAL